MVDWINPLATLVASFSGVGFAFLCNYMHEKKKIHQSEKDTLVQCKYIIEKQKKFYEGMKNSLYVNMTQSTQRLVECISINLGRGKSRPKLIHYRIFLTNVVRLVKCFNLLAPT